MQTLNSKVKNIKDKIYYLNKIHIIDEKGEKNDLKLLIDEAYLLIQGYMKDINYDEKMEKVFYKELNEFTEKSVTLSVLDSEWTLIEMIKK